MKLDSITRTFQNNQDSQNLLFNLNNQNPFKLMLMSSITQARTKYQLKLKDLNLGQIIELFPIDIPKEISIVQDLTQYQAKIPLLQEISYDTGNLCNEKGKDISLIKMFIQKSKELELKLKKYSEIEKVYEKDKEVYDSVYALRRQSLDLTYNKITQKLKEIYFKLSDGGDAMLSLIDQGDPFSEGIEFNVKPPGKTWKQISKLSGGEKTLASLSLMLALHFYRPTPLYILDEIDAALDFKNVGIVAQYLYQIKAQFIVVSLRTNMFEIASNLVGVYIKDGESSTIVAQLEIA